MLKSLIVVCCFLFSLSLCNFTIAQTPKNHDDFKFKEQGEALSIIPTPNFIKVEKGQFTINNATTIIAHDSSLLPIAKILSEYLLRLTNYKPFIGASIPKRNAIVIEYNKKLNTHLYVLDVGSNVKIQGNDYESIAHATASLIQLIEKKKHGYVLPKVKIQDESKYRYRSVMLDLARFWHPLETLYETVDLLWFYKIKYLQLHLSDDARVTFPLEDYPKLKTIGKNGEREYYTKQELQTLVAYAKERGVTIIPEIDLPGHSTPFWKLYPEVFGSINAGSNQPENLYVVNMVNEKTYTAINEIIKELAGVFYNSPYIHIGGDEVYLENLKRLPEYNEYVTKQGLSGDPEELFCYFLNRLNVMVKSVGKKTLVWEGFPNSGAGKITTDKDITVMAWNTSYNPPSNLLANGYKTINATWIPWYMVGSMNFAPNPKTAWQWNIGKWDHWQSDIPPIQLQNTADIIGAQITFWEQTYEQVISVLRSRVAVLSEKLWSEKVIPFTFFEKKFKRVNEKYQQLFRPTLISASGVINSKDKNFVDTATISLSSAKNSIIRYKFSKNWDIKDLSNGLQYSKPFKLTESGVITAQSFDKNNKPIGYKSQEYFTKIQPLYHYKIFGPAPIKGWDKMPDSDTLTLLRQGYIGKMNQERLSQIDRKLFAKVKPEGHIDTRVPGQFNPYLMELTGMLDIKNTGNFSIQLQTFDGLAYIYVDENLIAKGKEFKNKPEFFQMSLGSGLHKLVIKYYYKSIQNQLSINYKESEMQTYEPIENLMKIIVPGKK